MIARDLDVEPASFRDMGPKRNPLGPDSPIAIRVRLLRRALGYEEATAFARFLDVPRTRLANVEGGHPLSSDLATRIKQRTGASRDWLYDGDIAAMPHKLLLDIQAVELGSRKGTTVKP